MKYYCFNAIPFPIFYSDASATVFKDGRLGRIFDVQYITYHHCNSPYQQIQSCSFSQSNCGIHCSSPYNHIGLKCYGEVHLILDDFVYYSKTNCYHQLLAK